MNVQQIRRSPPLSGNAVNVAGSVPKDVHQKARVYAFTHGMTLRELIAKAVIAYIDNDGESRRR